MKGLVAIPLMVGFLFACAGAQQRDDEAWSDSGGKEETIAYEKQLQASKEREREQLSKIGDLAAAKRQGKLDSHAAVSEVMGADEAGEDGDKIGSESKLCPSDPGPTYTCVCASGEKPDWAEKASAPAWSDGGYLQAVAAVEGMQDTSAALARAMNRAASKILALQKGEKTDAAGMPAKPMQAKIQGLESAGVFVVAAGSVLVWARLQDGSWKPNPEVFSAECSEPGDALYECDCDEGVLPDWIYRSVWLDDDGYVYASGSLSGEGADGERARQRALANLGRFVNGFTLRAKPVEPTGGVISSLAVSDLNALKVQFVASQGLLDGGTAVLIRMWIGL